MVKFARAILLKMRSVRLHLADVLGQDTLQLELRVGLHSGSVTAGVLRGKKSRFQLYGDTVNTASRMESNGSPGRIHISEATALELKKHGYERWLQRREDPIHAKGKGEMQTYWIVGGPARSATSGVSGEGSTSYYDETTTRHPLHDSDGEELLVADRDFESSRNEDDEFMLDLHEKLQHRIHTRRMTGIQEHQDDDESAEPSRHVSQTHRVIPIQKT